MLSQISVGYDHDVATISLARISARGALTTALLEELGHVLSEIAENARYRIVVLRSIHQRTFSPGMDIKELKSLSGQELQRTLQAEETVLYRLENLSVPTIAAISGVAVGGGLSLAVACDLRIADETSSFGLPVARIGLMPSANMMQRFVAMVGSARTKQLLLRGRVIDASTAEQWGLINEVVPEGGLDAAVRDWIADIRLGAPGAIRAAKRAVNLCVPVTASHSIPSLPPYFVDPVEFEEGITAFLGHREPRWEEVTSELSRPKDSG